MIGYKKYFVLFALLFTGSFFVQQPSNLIAAAAQADSPTQNFKNQKHGKSSSVLWSEVTSLLQQNQKVSAIADKVAGTVESAYSKLVPSAIAATTGTTTGACVVTSTVATPIAPVTCTYGCTGTTTGATTGATTGPVPCGGNPQCSSLTCLAGETLGLFQYTQDFSAWTALQTSSHPPGGIPVCNQADGASVFGDYYSECGVGGPAPGTVPSMLTCNDVPGITYYTIAPVGSCGQTVLGSCGATGTTTGAGTLNTTITSGVCADATNTTAAVGLGCAAANAQSCTVPAMGGTTTGGPTGGTTGAVCDPNTNGIGRQCFGPIGSGCDPLCGTVCAVGGAQPMMYRSVSTATCPGSTACYLGVTYTSNFSSAIDPMGGGSSYTSVLAYAKNDTESVGPLNICIDPVRALLGSSPTNYLTPNSATPGIPTAATAVNNKLVHWNGNYLTCDLDRNDPHRDSTSDCKCDDAGVTQPVGPGLPPAGNGYESEPIFTALFYKTALTNHKVKPTRSSQLWAEIVDLLRKNQKVSAMAEKVAQNVEQAYSKVVPNANACGAALGPGSFCCPAGKVLSGGGVWNTLLGPVNPDGLQCINYISGSMPPCPDTCIPTGSTTGGSTTGACTATALGAPCGAASMACGQSCDDVVCALGTTIPTDSMGGCIAGTRCSCNGLAGTFPTCQTDPSCSIMSTTTTASSTTGTTTTAGSTTGTTGTTTGSLANLYVDNNTFGNPISFYAATSQITMPSPTPLPANEMYACVPKCPVGTTHDPSIVDSCVCGLGQSFNKTTWSCQACAGGGFFDSTGTCVCPTGYHYRSKETLPLAAGTSCVPDLPAPSKQIADPTSEYFYSSDGVAKDNSAIGFPVCGANRMPTTYDLQVPAYSQSGLPDYTAPVTVPAAITINGAQFLYALPSPTASPAGFTSTVPSYAYAPNYHCACVRPPVAVTPVVAPPGNLSSLNLGTMVGPVSRMYPDTYDVISTQAGNGGVFYGMVAMDPSSSLFGNDARTGVNFFSGGSKCECPNVNEIWTATPGNQAGGYCGSALNMADPTTNSAWLLTTYKPVLDDGATSNVLNRANEIIDTANPNLLLVNKVIATVNIPASSVNPSALQPYSRLIWKCQPGYTLTPSGVLGVCVFNAAQNKCDATAGYISPVSPYAHDLAGLRYAPPPAPVANPTDMFNLTVNKKLACCVNAFSGAVGSNNPNGPKYDCIDNTVTPNALGNPIPRVYTSFDDLLINGADSVADGGQPSALILSDTNGNPVTGWYSLNGARLQGYSEFVAGGVHSAIINPAVIAGNQQLANGSTAQNAIQSLTNIPPPTGSGTIITGLGAKAQEPYNSSLSPAVLGLMRTYPILVRAALKVSCPQNPQGVGATHKQIIAGGEIRCPQGIGFQVHIQVRQMYQIAGQAPIPTVDTVINTNGSSTISIDQIWQFISGNICPVGTTQQGDTCVY